MKQTLARLMETGDQEEQQSFFRDVRFVSLFTQWVGVTTFIGACLLLPPGSHINDTQGWLVALGMALTLALSLRCRTLITLNLSSVLFVVCAATGFRVLENGLGNPGFWVLPIAIIISLTLAPLFNSTWMYLGLICSVWIILGYGYFPFNPGLPDEQWPKLIIGSSLLVGLVLNVCFRLLRRKNFKAQKELERMAFQDGLTGINNRRSFIEGARKLQAGTENPTLYFLMIDIDDFKKINDTLGHDAGDQILKKTADIIAQQSGQHLCGRLGGEEFGVVFSGDQAAVCGFAAMLVAAVHAAFHPPHAVSISVGIAGLIKDRDLSESYRSADEALYRAKHAGKNCYVLA